MKYLYITLGFLSILLGVVGAFLPVMPTTPFLLLALFCFGKSSPRLQAWFIQTKIYKKYLKEFDERRAMTMKQKISILAFAFPFCAVAFFMLPHIAGKIFLLGIMMIKYWYFFCRIKTITV